MFRRAEIRIGRRRIERRTRHLSLRGWKLAEGETDAIDLADGEAPFEALASWGAPRNGRPPARSRITLDDALVQYGVVAGLPDARTVNDYRTAARLRCEALFGWSDDRWIVSVASPPTTGAVLVCAARRDDLSAWEAVTQALRGVGPTLEPDAIDALASQRHRIPDDGLVAVVSRETLVGFTVRKGAIEGVVQERDPDLVRWDDEEILHRLDLYSKLGEPTSNHVMPIVLDTRDWGAGAVLSKGQWR